MVGHLKYQSLNYEDVQPKRQWYTYNESSKVMTLSDAPSQAGLTGILPISYKNVCNKRFERHTGRPDEYHWIYVLGLAEYIAKAIEEDAKALDYGTQYRNALNSAAQNYWKGDKQ